MSEFYGVDGKPISMEEWGMLRRDWGIKRVAETKLGGVYISTVWLGMDHNYGDGPPIIFETMIFGGEHDEYCDRYATLEEAKAGHENVCNMVAPQKQ